MRKCREEDIKGVNGRDLQSIAMTSSSVIPFVLLLATLQLTSGIQSIDKSASSNISGCSDCSKLVFDESFCPRTHICTDQLVRSNQTCSSSCEDSTLWVRIRCGSFAYFRFQVNQGFGWRISRTIYCDPKQKKEKKPVKYSCSVREGSSFAQSHFHFHLLEICDKIAFLVYPVLVFRSHISSLPSGCTKCPIPNLLMTLPNSSDSNFTPIDNMRMTPTGKEGLCTQLQCDEGYKMIVSLWAH